MPANRFGQLITFAIERDEDLSFRRWHLVPVKRGDSVASVARRYGHPDDARAIADRNNIRAIYSTFGKGRKHILVPGELRSELSFHVLAGDDPPRIVDGYAKLSTIDRPERVGISTFDGYNPIAMEVPIRFEARRREGIGIERDIALLERMAGRGRFAGAATGPPPIIRLTTTRGADTVPLIPYNYQYSDQHNRTAPLWRIQSIDWDAGALRNRGGNRIRQLAVVTVLQHVSPRLLARSAAARARRRQPAGRTRR